MSIPIIPSWGGFDPDYLRKRLNEKEGDGGGEPPASLNSTPPNRDFPARVSPSSTPSKRMTPRGRIPFMKPHVIPLGVILRYSQRITSPPLGASLCMVSPTICPFTTFIRSVILPEGGSSGVILTSPTHSPMNARASSGVGNGVASSDSTVSTGGGR